MARTWDPEDIKTAAQELPDVPEYSEEHIKKSTIHALMEVLSSSTSNPQAKASSARTLAEITRMIGKNTSSPVSSELENLTMDELNTKIAAIERELG